MVIGSRGALHGLKVLFFFSLLKIKDIDIFVDLCHWTVRILLNNIVYCSFDLIGL